MKKIDFSKIEITGGFWSEKQKLVRNSTVKAVYDRFNDTGRIDAFKFDWKEGMPNKPSVYWDSDIAKWIESVAYITAKKRNAGLERLADAIINNIEKNQCEDGYFNIYFTVVAPESRFTIRGKHELYCAGHLIEAAVAYYQATGKRKLLDCMLKYVDYIEKRFMIDKDTPFVTPGHEEIELALVRLYDLTGDERHLALAKFFVDERGMRVEDVSESCNDNYNQSAKPVREQTEAVGHAVRAVYLYCAMADLAKRTGDEELRSACRAIFDDIINKKMYVTGGIGSSNHGEAFTVAYDLPNIIAYTESCAALGLALFANRMLEIDMDSKYSDTVERVIYNGFLSSISLDGRAFFYENPLEIIPYMHTRDTSTKNPGLWLPKMQRSEVFACSCCPPNIVRFIASIANLIYTDDGETLYVNQYMESKTEIERAEKKVTVTQKTKYPENGKVQITVCGADMRLAVRVPGWCTDYKGETKKGYAYFDVKDGETIELNFGMKVRFIEAKPDVVFNCNRYAVMRGPIVYCSEAVDNGENLRDLRIDTRARTKMEKDKALGANVLMTKGYRRKNTADTPLYSEMHDSLVKTDVKLIPYYAFANRGISEMQVWHYVK